MGEFKPREYQVEGIDRCRLHFQQGARSVLRQCPTGGGKTEEFCWIARSGAALGTRTLINLHRRELRRQTSARLRCEHGIIDADHRAHTDHLIQVASEDTLIRRLDEWRDWADLVISDECHHDVADKRRRIMEAFPRARLLGFTATPERLDGKGLGDVYERLVPGPSVEWLQNTINPDTGLTYLAKHVVYSPSTVDVTGLRSTFGDFDGSALAKRAAKLTGDAVDHYRKYADGLPTLVSCVSVWHAQQVAERFRAAGYRFLAVSGKTPADERDQSIADLSGGRLNGICYCDLFTEGLDCPGVYCGIMLRPTDSLSLFLQIVGRILRPFPGKDRAILLDHAGNCLRHKMLPDTPVEWTLKSTREKRLEERESRPGIRKCELCLRLHEWSKECPYCGYVYPSKSREPETAAGELNRLDRIEVDPVEKVRRKNRIRSARSYEELKALGKEFGYKGGWAHFEATRRRLPSKTPVEGESEQEACCEQRN